MEAKLHEVDNAFEKVCVFECRSKFARKPCLPINNLEQLSALCRILTRERLEDRACICCILRQLGTACLPRCMRVDETVERHEVCQALACGKLFRGKLEITELSLSKRKRAIGLVFLQKRWVRTIFADDKQRIDRLVLVKVKQAGNSS